MLCNSHSKINARHIGQFVDNIYVRSRLSLEVENFRPQPSPVGGALLPKSLRVARKTENSSLPPWPPSHRSKSITPLTQKAADATQLTIFRPKQVDIDILLPSTAHEPHQAFAQYISALKKYNIFSDAASKQAIGMMTSMPTRGTRPFDRSEPLIGILLSDLNDLLPGNSWSLQSLVGRLRDQGCRPVLIPPAADVVLPQNDSAARQAGVLAMAQLFDGLFSLGGDDIHPRIYRQPLKHAQSCNYRRDRFEADFLATSMNLPVFFFGICRGHQLYNVVAGGSLSQDGGEDKLWSVSHDQRYLVQLPNGRTRLYGFTEPEHVVQAERGPHSHTIDIEKNSRISIALGGLRRHQTGSHHHQTVMQVAPQVEVSATVKDPGTGIRTVEATESAQHVSFQFHPDFAVAKPVESRLMDLMPRRARIFSILRQLRELHAQVTPCMVTAAMKEYGQQVFDKSDYAWVRQDFSDILLRV